MSDYSLAALRKLDFMLLLVLTEGVRRKKLADVAAKLGVTQTAISHSVARLRETFEDELFIRLPHGVEPTKRAIELAALAEDVIENASAMLTSMAAFDPTTAERNLRICALDYEVTLLSSTLESLRREAPGIRLEFRGLGSDAAINALEQNDADLWLGFARQLPGTLKAKLLFQETYKVVSRIGHPRIADTINLDRYCVEAHVLAAPGATAGGIVDKTLRGRKRTRTIAVMTTSFLSVLDIVARTDLIATVPKKLAEAQAEFFKLQTHDPPVMPRPFKVSAIWHRRASNDPAIIWLIQRLSGAWR